MSVQMPVVYDGWIRSVPTAGGRVTQSCDFTDFVRVHTGDLVRTAYLLTGSADAAEELVQDTLVRLYPKWDLVQRADVPLAYVRRSLSNRFVNHTRRAARREFAFDVVPEPSVDRTADPAGQIDDRDQIWAMLRTLPARQRAAIVLRFYHDQTDDEIGEALSCRVGTVRSLVSRGLAAMRQQSDTARSAS